MNIALFSGVGDATLRRTDSPSRYRSGEIKSTSMSLCFGATGVIGIAAVQALAAHLTYAVAGGSVPSRKYVNALGATINDLLRAASYDPPRACSRPLNAGSFSDHAIGYRPFARVLDDLVAHGFVGMDKGYRDSFVPNASYVTRLWATSELLRYLDRVGVTPANRADHFSRMERSINPTTVIRLKGTKPPRAGKREFEAPIMPVDITDPIVAALAQDVQALNDFLFQQVIDGGEFNGLYRGFNRGDNPAFAWNMGGRLYNEYGGYQQDSKDTRPGITINGVATAEIDITASHLTILHGLMGVPLPAGNDPYAATDLPRDIAKAWIAMTLGDDHYHKRWTPRVSAALKESPLLDGKSLQAAFPIAKVRETILDKLPLLQNWDKNTTRWGQFQFLESEIIISTMKKLSKWHNCPALPVHDSIIVPQNKVIMAEAVFRKVFQDKAGNIPYVRIR